MLLEARVAKALRRLNVPAGAGILVALSGGGDSTGLLALLAKLRNSFPLKLAACRVSHHLREPLREEAESVLCRKLCLRFGVPFDDLQVPPGDLQRLSRESGRGLEQEARTLRHRFLERARHESGASFTALGHSADDQLETLLMRLLRGAGPEGLSGIPPLRGPLIRPLLGIKREEIRLWLKGEDLKWVEDPGNADPRFLRNRIRLELLPLLSAINPGWPSALQVLGERASEASAALSAAGDCMLPMRREGEELSWDEQAWLKAPSYLKAGELWKAFDHIRAGEIPDERWAWGSLKEAREMMDRGRSWEGRGLRMERQGGRVRIFPANKGDGRHP